MDRLKILLVCALFAGVALAGCATDEDGGTGGTTTTTIPTGTTGTTTTTPATTTPVTTTTPPVGGNVTGTIARVVVLSAPDRMAAPGDAEVCARVEGSGRIPHVAVHWDTAPHPNATAFSAYAGGAVYPGGATTLDPTGYALPGVFCFPLPVADETVYFRAHALAPPALPGVLSIEHAVRAGAAEGIRFTTELPEVAPAGAVVRACWEATVSGSFGHTAIHWDTESHPNATAFAEYGGGAVYPNNTATAGTYEGPGPYCANLTMPDSGAIYFRAHELVPGSVNNLSDEEAIAVGSPVSVTVASASAAAGEDVLVCWRVEGTGTIPHTAVHFDDASHPSATAFSEYAGGASYPDNQTSAAAGGYALPGPFCTTVQQTAGGLYFRAHALQPGARNELSDEVHIESA